MEQHLAKLLQNNIARVALMTVVWVTIWSLTQGPFMSDFWLFDRLKLPSEYWYGAAGLVAAVLVAVTLVVLGLRDQLKDLFPASKVLVGYFLVPAALGVFFARHGANGGSLLLAGVLIVSVVWQDLLTFGLYQLYVTKKLGQLAWVVVGCVFWLGHVVFFIDNFWQHAGLWALFLVVGLFLAWLTKRTRALYAADIVHLVFILAV